MERAREELLSRRTLLAGIAAPAAAWPAGAAPAEEERPSTCAAEADWADGLVADLRAMAARLTATVRPWPVPGLVRRPEEFGHRSGSEATATGAIQSAVDACAASGGGTVRLGSGDYVSGTIVLRSGVMLEVATGARLLGSTDLADYPPHVARRVTVQDTNMGMNQSLIFAEGCRHIGIGGGGTIDGRGDRHNFPGLETVGATPGRPFVIRFVDCTDVVVRDVRLRDSPCWMQNYLNCENLLIDGIDVDNQANFNNDGLDISSCRRVVVRNATIRSEDDTVCFKGAGERPTEQVLVENCRFFSSCNAIKFGTDSQAPFRDVLVRDLVVGGLLPSMVRLGNAKSIRKSDGSISWETVDGGAVERVVAERIHVVRSESPFFLRRGDRGRVRPPLPKPPVGTLRRIVFQDVTGADNGARGSFFIGNRGAPIEDVLLRRIDIPMHGAGTPAVDEAAIPDDPDGMYPDPHMFDATLATRRIMPAYGLWTRHVHGLTLDRVRVTLDGADRRPAFRAGPDTAGVCGAIAT